MAEPPRDPMDPNMPPPRLPLSVHPGQSPAPLQSGSPPTASNRIQAPPTAVPDTYGLNPATGQPGQHVSAASYVMGPPPSLLPRPARASQANGMTAYNPAPPSDPHAQHVPATPNVMGSPPLQHAAGATHINDSMAYSSPLVQPPTMNEPAPFMVPPGMRVAGVLEQNDPWQYLGINPPGEPLRITRPHGRQTLGALAAIPVSPHETQPGGRARFGPGFGGTRPHEASPSRGAVSQRVGTVQSGLILPPNANSPLRHSRSTPTAVAGPPPQSDSSLQESQRPSSTLRHAVTPDQATRQHHTNHPQQQFRPPASAMNNSHLQHGIWTRENQELPTTTQNASPSGQLPRQHHRNLLPQQVQQPVTATNNSDPHNSMPPLQNRRLPVDNQNEPPFGQARVPAMVNSSSQPDVQNPQGATVALSGLLRRADSMIPASEPARKRPRLDGAFSPAHLSGASDLPAACVGENSGDGAAPRPPGLKDFLQKRQDDARAEGKTPAVVRDALLVQNAQQLPPLDRNCAVCGLDLGSSQHPALLAARLDHLELCMQRESALNSSGPLPTVPLANFWSDERMVRSLSTSDLDIDMASNRIHLQTSFDEASKVYYDPTTSNAWKQRQLPFLRQAESDITRTNRDFPMHDGTRELVFKRMAAASKEKKESKELVARVFKKGVDQNVTLAPESKVKIEVIPKDRSE